MKRTLRRRYGRSRAKLTNVKASPPKRYGRAAAPVHPKIGMQTFVLRGGPTLDGGAFPGRTGGVFPNTRHIITGLRGHEVTYRRTDDVDSRGRVVFEYAS